MDDKPGDPMTAKPVAVIPGTFLSSAERKDRLRKRMADFPWWFAAIILIAVLTIVLILTNPDYREAFTFIRTGLWMTIYTTLVGFTLALVIGLVTGFGRISDNVFFKNASTLYVELVRGIPMLVLIFFIAFVGVPAVVSLLNGIGKGLVEAGLGWLGGGLAALENRNISMDTRAVIALATTYGAFLAEIFRAGIQSIGRGQMEAARSEGMTYAQAMRYIILPQAVRNMLPALGNDFISMLKDSALVSVLAVRDITQVARLYAGQSFRFQQAYITLAALYLTMTMILSLLVKWLERRYRRNA
jgi:polar amino acid transport system permease protein